MPYAEVKDAFRPESLLPLKISESQARDLIRAWYQRQWLAPNALNARALTDTVKGIYLPYWTFDAQADARWTADSGTYYYTMSNGKRERHVRWTPAAGELSHVFDDDLVPASLGVNARWLRAIEPFPTTQGLIPYDAGYLSGWTVERYQIDLVGAAARSREQMNAALRQLCAAQVPGDTYRNLDVQATFTDQRFKHILVPVWLMTYTYGATSLSGRRQRRHRSHGGRQAVELGQDHAAHHRHLDHCEHLSRQSVSAVVSGFSRRRRAADDPTPRGTGASGTAGHSQLPIPLRSRCDRDAGTGTAPDRSGGVSGVVPQIDALQLRAEQGRGQPAHPLVEVAEHDLRARSRADRDTMVASRRA